jgi:hypothetical protein
MSSTATVEQLRELHRNLVEFCLEYLRVTPLDKVSAFMLSVIRSLLRDNGIVTNMAQVRDIKASLADLKEIDLPFFN